MDPESAMKNLSFPGLPRMLVIDDEEAVREELRRVLQAEGVAVETAVAAADGVRRLEQRDFDVVFLDTSPAGAAGASILSDLRRGTPAADVVILAAAGYGASAVEAMKEGASDVIEVPFQADRVLAVVRRILETRLLRNEVSELQDRVRELTSTELVGLSPAIRDVQTRVDQIAHAADASVLVTGEGGTGKELVARCIHERSARRNGPFVTVNCAALSEGVLEAGLFGHEPGAFSGSPRYGKPGLFAAAAGGTLFLDEIGQLPRGLQAKLLRVLQERTFRRVGGVQDLNADVRIIASTKRNLRREVEAGNFREDLFHRLNAMTVDVARLADRAQDIPLLSHFFLDQVGRQMGKSFTGFTDEAMETLGEHEWPGNVRELKNAIEYAAIACPSGMIDENHLPRFTGGAPDGSDRIVRNTLQLELGDRSIRNLEGRLVAKVLEDTRWNISRAASILGINRTTLYNKIRLYGLGTRPGRAKIQVGV